MEPVGVPLLQSAAALALLFVGGEALVAGASALALRLGVSPLVVGLTVVACGTSAPELIVSVDAALSGANDIAVGNVVGSNIANIALILGCAGLVRPMAAHEAVVRRETPVMLGVSLLLVAMLANGIVSRIEGCVLVVALIGFVASTWWQATSRRGARREDVREALPAAGGSLGASAIRIAGGLASLVVGGHLLVSAAVSMAAGFGVSEATIGLTVVAVGTSLPELVTSVVAAARGAGDIAIGNVVGSNVFNVLGILGATSIIRPLRMGGVEWIDLGVMVALAALLLPLLVTGSRLSRREAAALLAVYVGYTGWVLAA